MTSKERHEARYQRRKAKRLQKRIDFAWQFLDAEDIFGTLALIKSFKKCRQGVHWKPSVQAYKANLVLNSRKSSKAIFLGKWKTKGFHEFDIVERGKPRHIKSVNFEERCIQRSLCDNCITPILSHYLIYDNGATLANKGTDFALNRVTNFLHKYYRKYGLDGYVVLLDFSQYFANIDIKKLIAAVHEYVPKSLHRDMYDKFVEVFKGEGLGLGSQVSQISAVFYGNPIDHLVKDQLGNKFYERYMDDIIALCRTKQKAYELINHIKTVCCKLGIVLNNKKCQIIPLHKSFQFLKIKFFITDSGKVVRRFTGKVARKERQRLKKFKNFMIEGKMTYEKINKMFYSWLYSQKRAKNYTLLLNMVIYYNNLYDVSYKVIKPKKKKSNHQYHNLKYICARAA